MDKSNKQILIEIAIGMIIGVLLCIPIFVYQHMEMSKQPEEVIVTKSDTVTIHHIDTLLVKDSDIKYVEKRVLDTVYVKDTIFHVEQLEYKDSLAEIYISGIQPSLDSVKYFYHRDTLVINNEIERTIVPKDSFWKNRFTLSAGVGAGYGLITKQPDIYVGATVGIRIF